MTDTPHRPQNPPHVVEGLIEAGKDTRFGGANANPHSSTTNKGGAKPWSIRNSLKNMANRTIAEDVDVDAVTEYELAKKILPTKTPTLVQIAAARQLAKIAKGGGDIGFITEQIDGKLSQTNINADFAAILSMTDDELKKLADAGLDLDTAAEGGSSDSGVETES